MAEPRRGGTVELGSTGARSRLPPRVRRRRRPRAVELRGILDEDLDERYREADADDTPEVAAKKRAAALAVHPEQVVATLIAVDADGSPLGHVMLRRLGDEWSQQRLIVVEAARRRGVGRALTAEVVDLARAEARPA